MYLYNLFIKFLNIAYKLAITHLDIALILILFYIVYIVVVFYEKKGKGHVRGAKIIKPDNKFIKLFKKAKPKNKDSIFIGDVELSKENEDKQNFILGRPGAGKTTIFNSIINKLISRNERGIIYDVKGDYIQKFYDPEKDLILNIADTRGFGWSIANEINDKADLVSLAESLIFRASGAEQHWNDTARGVFTAVLRLAVTKNHKTNKDIFAVLNKPVDDLLKLLQDNNQPEAVYISNPKNSSDVMSTLMRFISWLEYAEDGDFTISNWLNDKTKRFIFISNATKISDIQRPLLTLFIDFFVKIYLSLPDDTSRRMYFLLDEFGTLNKLSAIKDMLVLGRSKGLCAFLGVQDVGQIDTEYQEQTRNTIINACSNIALLAQNDPTTAELASKIMGQSEIWQTSHSLDQAGRPKIKFCLSSFS